MARKSALVTIAAVLCLLGSGCAKFPANVAAGTGAQLVVTMTVSGAINPAFYYFVVVNTSNDPNGANGPVPVIAPPWGNGFVAGTATHFVEYNGSLPGDGYTLNSFIPGTSLQQYTAIGVPTQDTPVSTGSNTLQFRVPLSQFATGSIAADQITHIQVNFLTTDRLPINPQDTSPKLFDALGNTDFGSGELNNYITIPVDQSATFSNLTRPIEPSGDVQQTNGSGGYSNVNEPDVDITGWSVQVVR